MPKAKKTVSCGSTPRALQGITETSIPVRSSGLNLGEVDIKVSRDRNGSFEPKIISKYGHADGIEEKIL